MNLRETLRENKVGHLEIGGCDAIGLAREFGTPLYVFDEAYIRSMCRIYKDTLDKEYSNSAVLYASKAFSCKAIYKIIGSEGLGADVVSGGELYTALSAGFPAARIYLHGNNKTPKELEYAIDSKVGAIVADSVDELDYIDKLCEKSGYVQRVLIRVNPGVEAHTHHFIQTAKVDSKFGFSVSNGDAFSAAEYALGKKNLRFAGIHAHIGSQIFETKPYALAVEKLTDFIKELKDKTGYEAEELNLGGGFGIWYSNGDKKTEVKDYSLYIKAITDALKAAVKNKGIKSPKLVIEPGRSIVGEAGVTLYSVGSTKEIKDIRTYVNIDGGMFENPRYALYQAKYTAVAAADMYPKKTKTVTLAGKCCESSDMIAVDIELPDLKRGDIVAVFSTGAYNYSMASNYNRNGVPPSVLVNNGKADLIIKGQTFEDILRNDVLPDRLK